MAGIIALWNHIQLEHAIITGCHRYLGNFIHVKSFHVSTFKT